ncbi:transcription repressor OFP1-like [Typha latifolia]|uniref:transcription repressor OFP1-like n=1 Tax=Typha latifolia TaxID=4733 RepID=UPI003C2D9633
MGKHKFSLSEMMPNSWFHLLKHMKRAGRSHGIPQATKRSHHRQAASATPKPSPPPKQAFLPNRASYYFPSKERLEKFPHLSTQLHSSKSIDTHFPTDSPKKSKRRSIKKPTKPSIEMVSSVSTPCVCTSISSNNFEDREALPELKLTPILTKPIKKEANNAKLDDTNVAEKKKSCHSNRKPASGKVRLTSPRLVSRRIQTKLSQKLAGPKVALEHRRGLMESFVIVKSSLDPERDFRESMIEMIIKNKLLGSSDLEELLACYLSLNSQEYHEVIVKVFKQIWLSLNDIKL